MGWLECCMVPVEFGCVVMFLKCGVICMVLLLIGIFLVCKIGFWPVTCRIMTFTHENLRVPFCQSVLANSCEIDSLADPIRRALDADAVGGGWTWVSNYFHPPPSPYYSQQVIPHRRVIEVTNRYPSYSITCSVIKLSGHGAINAVWKDSSWTCTGWQDCFTICIEEQGQVPKSWAGFVSEQKILGKKHM